MPNGTNEPDKDRKEKVNDYVNNLTEDELNSALTKFVEAIIGQPITEKAEESDKSDKDKPDKR